MIARAWLAAVFLVAPLAQAQMFKCVGKDGKIAYQAEPCPDEAKGQRMGPSGAPAAAGRWRDGWTAEGLEVMAAQCRDHVIIPARKGYALNNVPFPERLIGEVSRHCDCVADVLGRSYSLAQYKADRLAINRKSKEWADQCPPEGLHAELVKKGFDYMPQ